MKFKENHIKILQNFLHYNSCFGYDGNHVLKTKDQQSVIFLEVYIPDFIDLPIYTKDLVSILKFITPDTDVTMDVKGGINYLILKNESGTIRFRLSKEEMIKRDADNPYDFNVINITESWYNFNLDYNTYKNMMKYAKLLECDIAEVYSIDEHKIGITCYRKDDEDDKRYTIEVERDHVHDENHRSKILLDKFEFVQASDYNIEVGLRQGKRNLVPITKVKAFCDNLEMRYIIINKNV